jgi:hypothetical protein
VSKVVAYIHASDKQDDGDKSGKLIHLDVTGSGQIFRVSDSCHQHLVPRLSFLMDRLEIVV